MRRVVLANGGGEINFNSMAKWKPATKLLAIARSENPRDRTFMSSLDIGMMHMVFGRDPKSSFILARAVGSLLQIEQ